jgi:hypothetical protein
LKAPFYSISDFDHSSFFQNAQALGEAFAVTVPQFDRMTVSDVPKKMPLS